MISRINNQFSRFKKDNRTGLVGYLTAGDPDYKTSLRNILGGIETGIDVLELGIPFSDPTADGPVIQAASQRALSSGMTVKKALSMVEDIRKETDIPIIMFGYSNPFFHYGFNNVARDAATAGADGMLIVDLPFEETEEINAPFQAHDLAIIPLIAPTTGLDRMKLILSKAQGFIYYIMVTGVTGKRSSIANNIKDNIHLIRQASPLPIAAGFGISNGEQASMAADSSADAVVVGSALVDAAQNGKLLPLVAEISAALTK